MHGVTFPPPRHHRFWIKCACLHGNDSLLPLSVSVRMFFFLKDPLCVLGTLRSDATTTRPVRRLLRCLSASISGKTRSETAELLHWPALSRRCLRQFFSCRPHTLFLRFGLDNLLPVTLSRSFDVLENRAFVTRKKCKLCSVRAERARNLLSSTLKHAGVLCTVGGQFFDCCCIK